MDPSLQPNAQPVRPLSPSDSSDGEPSPQMMSPTSNGRLLLGNIEADPTSPPPKYLKLQLLGKGSYGEVWKVKRAEDGAIFAAKTIPLKRDSALSYSRQCAIREIQCLAAVAHPNIIRFEESFFIDGCTLVIVMEYADAGDMAKQIKFRSSKPPVRHFEEAEVMTLFLQLCLALNHIHGRAILHRDIKASNVFVNTQGVIKLADFGFSRQYQQTVSSCVGESFCGTPHCVAPELWRNERYSNKADMWSLGVLLYEITAMRRPFEGETFPVLISRVVSGPPEPLPSCYSSELSQLTMDLLATRSQDRPDTDALFRMPYVRKHLSMFRASVMKASSLSSQRDLLAEIDRVFPSTAPIERLPAGSLPVRSSPPPASSVGPCLMEGVVRKLHKTQPPSEKYLRLTPAQLILSQHDMNFTDARALPLDAIATVMPITGEVVKGWIVFGVYTKDSRKTWFAVSTSEQRDTWLHFLSKAIGSIVAQGSSSTLGRSPLLVSYISVRRRK